MTLVSIFVCAGPLAAPTSILFLLPATARAELVDDDTEELKTANPATTKPGTKPALQQTEEEKASTNKTEAAKKQGSKEFGAPEAKSKQKPTPKNSDNGVVKFWSKNLSGFREQGSLMLEQDVVVNQNDVHIEADKATIFFTKGGNEVTQVHAVGNVKFSRIDPETGLPITADGQEAVFDNAKRIVIMKGDPVLHRGSDTVRGKVIQYDLTNGWVKADRVEGVVQPVAKKVPQK